MQSPSLSPTAAQQAELPAIGIENYAANVACRQEPFQPVREGRVSNYAADLAAVSDDEPCFFARMGEIHAAGIEVAQ